jgi:hypothetical protein
MNTAHEPTMPMPAEFCSPDDAQDDPTLEQAVLERLGVEIEMLQLARYQAARNYQRAICGLRLCKGLPTLVERYEVMRDAAVKEVRYASTQLAKLQS